MLHTELFTCPLCGENGNIHQSKTYKGYIRRSRYCKNGHGFRTYQNGGPEEFDCWITGVNRNSIAYRQMKQTYFALKDFCEIHGNQAILDCLERARQRAGIMR